LGCRGGSDGGLTAENLRLTAGGRLDTHHAAHFLSYAGILLGFWRWTHRRDGATAEIGCARFDSREGLVEEEADGSWAGNQAIHRKVWPKAEPDMSNGQDQARRIPGDKFLEAAG
jgi:hypothetical protein